MSKKAYVIYSYDTMPFSDMPDYYFKAFLNKLKALEFVKELNQSAWREWEKDKNKYTDRPASLYDFREIDLNNEDEN